MASSASASALDCAHSIHRAMHCGEWAPAPSSLTDLATAQGRRVLRGGPSGSLPRERLTGASTSTTSTPSLVTSRAPRETPRETALSEAFQQGTSDP